MVFSLRCSWFVALLLFLSLVSVRAFIFGTSLRADYDAATVQSLHSLAPTHVRVYGHMSYVLRQLPHTFNASLTLHDARTTPETYIQWFHSAADFSMMDAYVHAALSSHTDVQVILELGEGTVTALPWLPPSRARQHQQQECSRLTSTHRTDAWTWIHNALNTLYAQTETDDSSPDRDWRTKITDMLQTVHEAIFNPAAATADTDCLSNTVSSLVPMDPNVIGLDSYLAWQYIYTRSMVRRYIGFGVNFFQLENELNAAWTVSLAGVRFVPNSMRFSSSNVWYSFDSLTRILHNLATAVRDESSLQGVTATITHNLHASIPAIIFSFNNCSQCYFLPAAQQWAPFLDYIALDSYPNFLIAHPLQGTVVVDAVSQTMQAINGTKPVFIMETGYPCLAPGISPATAAANWSEADQVQYAQQVVNGMKQAGGAGLMWFTMGESQGITYNFTDIDATLLNYIAAVMTGPVTWPLIQEIVVFALENFSYLLEHFPQLIHQINKSWGMLYLNGQPRPIVAELARLFHSEIPQ